MILRRTPLLAAIVIALIACSAGIAQAGTTYDFRVGLDDGVSYPSNGGTFQIDDLDMAQTRRIVTTTSSGTIDTGILAAGANYYASPFIAGLAVGDTISVRQPGNAVSATESFTVPSATLSVVTGATALTGTVPAGWIGFVRGDYRCEMTPMNQLFGAGAFNMPYSKVLPGEVTELSLFNSNGDEVNIDRHSPGETPCYEIDAVSSAPGTPGGAVDPNAYELDVNHLLPSVAPSVRMVLRRGSTVIADVSEDNTSTDVEIATKPLPGDIIEIYRPKTAPTPAHSLTLPQVSGVFDPAVDLVAMKTPAAGLIKAEVCRPYVCGSENDRSARDVPAGANFLNFGQPQSTYAAIDLRPDDVIEGVYQDPDFTMEYRTDVTTGDLVAPAQSIKLASNLKRKTLTKAFKKGYKVKVKSNEAGSASLTLAFPKAKAGKAVTLAKASRSVIAGTTTVKLKFTKAGKKALKKLRKRSSRLATLTSIVTDASGNVSTLVKRAKIKA